MEELQAKMRMITSVVTGTASKAQRTLDAKRAELIDLHRPTTARPFVLYSRGLFEIR